MVGMEIVCGVLVLVILLLLCKIVSMRRAAREIGAGLEEKLKMETNTLLTIGCRDGAMRELTEQINAQLRCLRDLRHRYEQGNMALKETITNVSHDIRTPLTAIYGYLELLEQEEKSESVRRYLEVVRNRAEVLRKLTEELFIYAASTPSDSVVVSDDAARNKCDKCVIMGHALEESISAHYGALKTRQITPEIMIPEREVICRLDSVLLSRVFANIFSNAVKYSDGDLRISLSETGEITFANHASALNEIQVGRLFDRFYTVENAEHATGLGLSIARTLTEQMGGSIAAQYADGMLTICLTFPTIH